jgi:hypothetical protein
LRETRFAGRLHLERDDFYGDTVQPSIGLFTYANADRVLTSIYGFGFLPTLSASRE